MDGLLRDLTSDFVWQIVWKVIVIIGSAGIFAELRRRASRHIDTFRNAAIGAACAAVLVVTITGVPVIHQPETTPDNVEENVSRWVEDLGVTVRKTVPPPANAYFEIALTLPNTHVVYVSRYKALDKYIQFRGPVAPAKDISTEVAKFTDEQKERLAAFVLLELSRAKIGFNLPPNFPANGNLTILKAVPITSGLTKDSFAGYLDDVDAGVGVTQFAFVFQEDIERKEKATTP